jgi:uncharacterized membrane protein (DUF485 family)
MRKEQVESIKNDPNFQELVSKRSRFAWTLTAAILIVYFSFILLLAYSPGTLGTPLSSETVTTVGIPVGVAIIVFAFALTGIYVRRANSEFDELTQKIKDKAKENE